MSRTLIRNAQVVFPNETAQVAVLIEGDKIVDIDPAGQVSADEVVDAAGLHLLPGVVDDQVHFREPGLTHKEDLTTASHACAAGGVTTYLEMPNTKPNATTQPLVEAKLALAAVKSLVNYGFYIGATPHNIAELVAAKRTPGIKIFIGSSTGDLLVDDQAALERIFAETKLPICAHCEDEATVRANAAKLAGTTKVADHSKIRDPLAAYIATKRALDLAQRHHHRFHVLHVSTGDEVDLIGQSIAGAGKKLITAEACLHHFLFSTDDYQRLGTLVQMNPSLKSPDDAKRVWQGLMRGRLQVIATDHAPHTLEEKQQGYPKSPAGLPAVENSLALMLHRVNQGLCSIEQVADWMCDAPARVWDVVDKGRIAKDYDADLVLVDMNESRTIRNAEQHTKSKWSPWDGDTLQGWPVRTWVMGKTVFNRGKFDENVRGREAKYDHARGGYWATMG
jgi:dihydroorotase